MALGLILLLMMANSADPDQTAPKEESDLGLHVFEELISSSYRN